MITPLLLMLALSSCQKGPSSEDLSHLEEQTQKLETLEAELALLREESATLKAFKVPKVPVEELQKELDEKKVALATLTTEVEQLRKTEADAKAKLDELLSKFSLEE